MLAKIGRIEADSVEKQALPKVDWRGKYVRIEMLKKRLGMCIRFFK
ncbi:hypothetical protein HMP0721_2470 [Pseudoramibacter alactolyticus ATCC 23263]|uniref:Uncharacterized protein n=1 Tax=Pseudoramibacter alactolyticus ATCC 23263 TaxID=887929 RepID=E6MKD4_9FIRM|nr:hypothetical protein HMP0721_2470 [Pseudoramibacter alactolyticus ATCC 23263]